MNTLFQKDIYELFLKYFGRSTAEAYVGLYADKSEDFILLSITELLTEYLGKEKAQEEIDKLKKYL
ncbi:MAG: hypothetical protein Q7T51_04880 [Candidatus Moranbacteria bacterium]|nr:hypothetical protein [Candidatus Moranbacteria bacterium]